MRVLNTNSIAIGRNTNKASAPMILLRFTLYSRKSKGTKDRAYRRGG